MAPYPHAFLAFFFVVSLAVVHAMPATSRPAKCSLGRRPFNAKLIGKKISGSGGCSLGGLSSGRSLSLEPWAVIFEEFYNTSENVCFEKTISVFRRSNKWPTIYYRPSATRAFFKKHHPAVWKNSLKKKYNFKWPCEKVPLKIYRAWGGSRNQFSNQLNNMHQGLTWMREVHCYDNYTGDKKSWNRKELQVRITRERIISSALSYIESVAFNSFLCIWNKPLHISTVTSISMLHDK